MKRVFFIMAIFAFSLTSCKKENKEVRLGTNYNTTKYARGARCTHHACHCDGFKGGYNSLSNYYFGKCQNRDGNGYTCQHSPREHGLRQK